MARRTPSTHVTYYIENRIRKQMQSDDGNLLFNPGVTTLSSPSGKILQICTHLPWASLDAQQFVSKSPLSYYTGTTAKFAAAIPYHVAFCRLNEGISKEELISFVSVPESHDGSSLKSHKRGRNLIRLLHLVLLHGQFCPSCPWVIQ